MHDRTCSEAGLCVLFFSARNLDV